jgi:undecaprenyl diphosphate synthase
LPAPLVALLEAAERKTAQGSRLNLRLAIDYSSRQAILDAARRARANVGEQEFSALMGPDVDLLIRTSGEQRLSDFLLWECAYAEMVFTSRMWPDFTAGDLAEAVAEFHRRDRRFGAVAAVENTRRTA